MIKKMLYLTYISINEVPTSASSVRPHRMKEALENLGLDVKTFDGISNSIKIRRKTVCKIRELLKKWKPDACYIEPPSGPMFYMGDIELIKDLHQMKIPISIFYRDAYWKYPEVIYEDSISLYKKIKLMVIKRLQVYQWNVFKNNIDFIYFPSNTMAREFDCPRKDALPPGTFIAKAVDKNEVLKPLQFIFIGGASKLYGTYLSLEAFAQLNANGVKAKVFYICPERQWKNLWGDQEKYYGWLQVIHTAGEENLKSYYEQSDVAFLLKPKNFYNDFAVNLKIFEYMSYLKPILVTNCTETARIVRENQIGWVVEDNVESIVAQLEYLCEHPDEIIKAKERTRDARDKNLWIFRAKKVVNDLESIL